MPTHTQNRREIHRTRADYAWKMSLFGTYTPSAKTIAKLRERSRNDEHMTVPIGQVEQTIPTNFRASLGEGRDADEDSATLTIDKPWCPVTVLGDTGSGKSVLDTTITLSLKAKYGSDVRVVVASGKGWGVDSPPLTHTICPDSADELVSSARQLCEQEQPRRGTVLIVTNPEFIIGGPSNPGKFRHEHSRMVHDLLDIPRLSVLFSTQDSPELSPLQTLGTVVLFSLRNRYRYVLPHSPEVDIHPREVGRAHLHAGFDHREQVFQTWPATPLVKSLNPSLRELLAS